MKYCEPDVYKKQLVKADKMMPATQMVFLELLYMNDEESVLKSEIEKKLNLTKTSITRASAQLEEMGLIAQLKSGTEISIKRNFSRKEYYENAKAYLINPVQKVNDCLNVQLWKYNPSYFAREGRVDPVSLACTFKGNDDERIEMCIEKLLEAL